jgi:hypothetical protein
MTIDEQIKSAQLEKLSRELALMPQSRLSFELLSKFLVPVLAVAAAGYAFWIGLPKAQLDLLRATREILDSERKLADAEKKRSDAELKRANLLADIERLQATVEGIQKQNENTAQSLNSILQGSTDVQTRKIVDKALTQVDRVDTSLAIAGANLSVAAQAASYSKSGNEPYAAYSVDIFYCSEAGAGAKSQAQAAFSMSKGKTAGRWRLRELAADINRRSGYGIDGNVVRFNAGEAEVAKKIRADVRAMQGVNIELQQIEYPTPNYISMFFCKKS